MSLIAQYYATKNAIAELQERLEKLEQDERLKGEVAFEAAIRDVLAEHGRTGKDLLAVFAPKAPAAAPAATQGQRAQRALKTYKNPHTGEIIETRGGNHTVLKQWKAQYGADEVKSWAS